MALVLSALPKEMLSLERLDSEIPQSKETPQGIPSRWMGNKDTALQEKMEKLGSRISKNQDEI